MVHLTADQFKVLDAIADTIFPAVPENTFEGTKLDHPIDIKQYAQTVPSKLPNFHEVFEREFAPFGETAKEKFLQILDVLGNRALAPLLTRSLTLFQDMSPQEREATMKMWRDSRFLTLRVLYRTCVDLITIMVMFVNDDLVHSMNWPVQNPDFDKNSHEPFWKPNFLVPTSDTLNYDVAIVGSGCAGGVAAYKLSKAGFRVLVIEQGKHWTQEKSNVADTDTLDIYIGSARLGNSNGTMATASGGIVGGGGAVNWSCSLDPTDGVRKEWAQTAPWYDTPVFDEALASVRGVMKTTTDVEHSIGNKLLLDGLQKLHWHHEVIPQNTGGHYHNTGFQGWGHRHGERGGVVNWLYEAQNNGADIICEAKVLRIIHKGGKATGVEVLHNGKKLIVKSKKVVNAAGTMSTPPLLLRSGFKNKNIGKGLRLHPAGTVFGEFDEQVNFRSDAIMTALSNEYANRDGKYHGPRLEVLLHTPTFMAKFLPWRDGQQWRRDLSRSMHLVPILTLTRDKDSGRVYCDPTDPTRPAYDYDVSPFDCESMKIGAIAAAKILYVEGAKRIIIPHRDIEDFVSHKTGKRYVTDPDFVAWLKIAENSVWDLQTFSVSSAHQMASCSVGNKGPSHSALDVNGRLHECKNVHVVDASAFPSASGSNPMISTMATSWVLTDTVIADLNKTSKL